MATNLVSSLASSQHRYGKKEDYISTGKDPKGSRDPMLGASGSPVRISPWSFIGSLNPKKQALSIARELDAQRGVQLDSSVSKENNEIDTSQESTHSTVRRLPSGARPPTTSHNIQTTTPIKLNVTTAAGATEESISNVAGQSTPLTQEKAIEQRNEQKKTVEDVESEKKSVFKKQIESDEGLQKITMDDFLLLREEMTKLKELNETQKATQQKMRIEFERMKGSLNDKAAEIESLREMIEIKESNIVARDNRSLELEKVIKIKEDSRTQEIEGCRSLIRDIRCELKENEREDNKLETLKSSSLLNMLDDLKDQIAQHKMKTKKTFQAAEEGWRKKIKDLGDNMASKKDEITKQHAKEVFELEGRLSESDKKMKSAEDKIDRQEQLFITSEEHLKNLQGEKAKQEAEKDNLQQTVADNKKVILKLTQDNDVAAKTAEEAVLVSDKMRISLEKEISSHNITKEKLNKATDNQENFRSAISNINLFKVQIGSIIIDFLDKKHGVIDFESFFLSKQQGLLGFYDKDLQTSHDKLEEEIKGLRINNQALESEIEDKWRVDLRKSLEICSRHEEELKELKEQHEKLVQQKIELENKLNTCQEDRRAIINEKNVALSTNATLLAEIHSQRTENHDKTQQKLENLLRKVENFTERISNMQEQLNVENERQIKLNESLSIKDLRVKDLEKICQQNYEELEQKRTKLHEIQGDTSKRITFEQAHKSRPDIERSTYEYLMLDKVDSIDMVELQNIVKNLILLLEIPFDKLTKKSPLVTIYLKYERPIFSHFANRLHYDMFNEPIDLKAFTSDVYEQYTESHNMAAIRHPLEGCLDNLYQKLLPRL